MLKRLVGLAEVFVWEPDHIYQQIYFQATAESSNCKFEKNWQATLPEYWDKDNNFKIYNPIALKMHPPKPCLTINEKKELIIYRDSNKDVAKPIWIVDIMTGKEQTANPDEMAGLAAASA